MNMKRLLILCSFVFISFLSVSAQNTNVSATIQDPSGQLFKNGNFIASFRRNPNNGSTQPRYSGSGLLINEGPFQGAISPTGTLSVTLADVLQVSPSGGQWTFVLCPNVSSGCTTVNISVTGGSQDISSLANTAIPLIKLSPGNPLARAYQDNEIQGGPGNSWLDVTLNVLKYIDTNGVIQTVGSGGNGNGCGAGSCVVNNPAIGISQTVVQQAGTDFATNILNKRMRADMFAWTILPASPASISAGTSVVTLPTCPLGINGTNLDHKLYLAGTGTPEIVTITGGTCTSGLTNGTIQFDAVNSHGAGYSLGTATGGLKEASEYSKFIPQNPTGTLQGGYVTVTPGVALNIQATAYIESAVGQTIDFSGSILECNVANNLPCVKMGNDINSNASLDLVFLSPRFRAMVPNTGPALAANANGSIVRNLTVRQALSGGYFGSLVEVDNDQAFTLDGINPNTGSWSKCDSSLCSTAIISNGPFSTNAGLAWIDHANLSGNCGFNGIYWKNNNTLHVSNSVVQSFAQFGIINDAHFGGFGNIQLTNVYEESDACVNPDYVAAGATGSAQIASVGLLTQTNAYLTGGEGPNGWMPTLVCSAGGGSRQYNYFIIIKDTTSGNSAPLMAAHTPIGCTGTVTVFWPKVQGTATVTYDVLRTSTVGGGVNIVSPYTSACTGGGVDVCGSVATNVAQCGGKVCSFSDTIGTNTTSYTVPPPLFKPYITFWPANVAISVNSDTSSGQFTTSYLYIDDTEKIGNPNGTGIVSVWGNSQSSIYALHCGVAQIGAPAVFSCVNGDPAQNNSAYASTLLGTGAVNGAQTIDINKKGRLNFWRSPNSSLESSEIITLVDATPDITAATQLHHPLGSALDTYIGIDSGSVSVASAMLAFNAPVAISQYIASLPDGTSYKERLTATLKLFTVPVQVNSGGVTNAIVMSDSTTNCGNTTTNTSQICSGTDGGNPYQPIWTSNISGSQVQSTLLQKINADIIGGYASIGSSGLIPITDIVADPSNCGPSTTFAGNQANCITAAGSTGFASLLGGTNNSGQAFIVGDTSSLTFSGTGGINAKTVNNIIYPTSGGGGVTGADKILISTAAGVIGAQQLTNCVTALTYSTSTHTFTCASTTTVIPTILVQCNGTSNACPSTEVTGTGAATALVTVSIPGGTLPANRCFHARFYFTHSTGSAATNFSWTFGGTTTANSANSSSTSNTAYADIDICNYNSSLSLQYIRADQYVLGNANLAGATTNGIENTASNQNLSLNFNVANTDKFAFNGGYITFP